MVFIFLSAKTGFDELVLWNEPPTESFSASSIAVHFDFQGNYSTYKEKNFYIFLVLYLNFKIPHGRIITCKFFYLGVVKLRIDVRFYNRRLIL